MRSATCVDDGIIYTVYTCTTCQILMNSYPDKFLDEQECVFPEGCIKEVLFDGQSPEDLLNELNMCSSTNKE